MVLTVYKADSSPPARAVIMTVKALNLTNVKFEDVNLMKGEHLSEEFLKLNPQHTVPSLKDDDFAIWDSHAISTYLVSKYGSGSSLYPTDLRKRAVVDQRLHFDSGILYPALGGALLPLMTGAKSFPPEALQRIEKAYEFLEKFLANSSWVAGDQLTLADISCVATVSSLNKMLPVDSKKFPKISAWLQKSSQQEFYKTGNLPGLLAFDGFIKSLLG